MLWIVGTPLGNPGDLSPRARQCLEDADLVLAEDTKRESLACARWGVQVRRFVSFHDHNEKEKYAEALEEVRSQYASREQALSRLDRIAARRDLMNEKSEKVWNPGG